MSEDNPVSRKTMRRDSACVPPSHAHDRNRQRANNSVTMGP
jgi:hypothetical protein